MMKNKFLFGLTAAAVLTGTLSAFAQTPPADIASAFRQYAEIAYLPLNVPAAVDVQFPLNYSGRSQFLVYDTKTGQFEPSLFLNTMQVQNVPLRVDASGIAGYGAVNMTDMNLLTYTEFPFADEGPNVTELTLRSMAPVISSRLTVLLSEYVALPTFITIHAGEGPAARTVLARQAMRAETVNFPEVSANVWTVTLEYAQPLRIAEIQLAQKNPVTTVSPSLRFLAQPGSGYRIYFDADRSVEGANMVEMPDLRDNRDVFKVPQNLVAFQQNQLYRPADVDGDGVQDILDNCVQTVNPDQEDVNKNGRGDACDDFDRDGVMNAADNCVNQPNRDQRDTDADGIGDVCDGEESRVTERYEWLPWLGIGFAGIVLVGLFIAAARGIKRRPPGV